MKTRPIDGVRITCQMPATLSRRVSLRGSVLWPGGSSLTISQISRPITTVTVATPRNTARQPKVAAVNARVSVPLFQGQFDAVVSWTYNLGEGALKSSTMLKKINAARHDEVPGQIKRWNRAGGKVLTGLERRREAEAALYEMRWY